MMITCMSFIKDRRNAGGIKPERVMTDALLKLAGELSLNAINEKQRKFSDTRRLIQLPILKTAQISKQCSRIIMPSILRKTFCFWTEENSSKYFGSCPHGFRK